MRLDRYTGQKPKFMVYRRVDDPAVKRAGPGFVTIDGTVYRRMPPFDYFVLALKDVFTPTALFAYAQRAFSSDRELADDVMRLAQEARDRDDRKIPD